ncbi:pollen-specific leucine-rich repeat extensin-like protein 1 [Schistocerca piceifrons]|uniref:pollen-specific leucine-rich repeat extensin-like protein 1 n=1 Tax=Schistocerca piceifrons TaxID=274613 RepID=UPI001F5ED887|nr:pollen-specific leucine-rich repeat extensin-like protein 1 [Schistocerca piceifrons]
MDCTPDSSGEDDDGHQQHSRKRTGDAATEADDGFRKPPKKKVSKQPQRRPDTDAVPTSNRYDVIQDGADGVPPPQQQQQQQGAQQQPSQPQLQRKCKLPRGEGKEKCANCRGAHPASYLGCPEYRAARDRQRGKAINKTPNHNRSMPAPRPPPPPPQRRNQDTVRTQVFASTKYSRALTGDPPDPPNHLPPPPHTSKQVPQADGSPREVSPPRHPQTSPREAVESAAIQQLASSIRLLQAQMTQLVGILATLTQLPADLRSAAQQSPVAATATGKIVPHHG